MRDLLCDPIATRLKSLARTQIDAAVSLLAEREPDAETTHQVRKICKQVSALVDLLRKPLGRARVQDLERFVRSASRALGATREAAVRLQTLREMEERHPDHAAAIGRVRIELSLSNGRSNVDQTVAHSLASLSVAQRLIMALAVPALDPEVLMTSLISSQRRVRRALRRFDKRDVKSAHALRKRLRRFTDQCRLFSPLWPSLNMKRQRALQGLNEMLGQCQDLSDLRGELLKVEARTGVRDAVIGLIEGDLSKQLNRAHRQGTRLLESMPIL